MGNEGRRLGVVVVAVGFLLAACENKATFLCVRGGPCQGDTACSVGDPQNLWCRTYLTCVDRRWQDQFNYSSCEPGFNDVCPPGPSEGASCSSTGELCSYPGTTCGCITGCESPLDAAGCDQPLVWHCTAVDTGSGCEPVAPQLQAPCSVDGVSCTYGVRCFGLSVTCTNGRWQSAGFDRGCI
jgi:hypothetical protein